MTRIGYARTSTADQNLAAQIAALKAAGCEVIREEQKSGSSLEGRPQLDTILDFIHAGETLVVTRIDRLARSLRDLQVIVDRLKAKGAHLYATEQPVDTSTAAGKAFFDMLGVFAEFETNLRRERQAEGIAAAKKARHLQGPAAENRPRRDPAKAETGPRSDTNRPRSRHLARNRLSGTEGQMTKGKRITRLTPAACEEIQTRMLEVCRKIAADHGLVSRAPDGAAWKRLLLRPVFRVSIPASDGTAFNLEKDRFEFLAEHYGLPPSDFGREFRTGSERFRITGIDPNGRAIRSPRSEFPTAEASNLPPKKSPCSCKPRRTSHDVRRLFRKLAKIAASGRLGR